MSHTCTYVNVDSLVAWHPTYVKPNGSWPGWPDWSNFRLWCDCLIWVVFVKITEVAQKWGSFFPWCNANIDFYRKWTGQHFGPLFYKRIWHPGRGHHLTANVDCRGYAVFLPWWTATDSVRTYLEPILRLRVTTPALLKFTTQLIAKCVFRIKIYFSQM
jgi:hypothetical protein